MKLFNLDSPLMQGLSKMADLMWLNVLTLLCCLPVVTMGASLTAMNYVALKIVRDEECYISKSFFKSFKENFRQATIIWLMILVAALILAGDYFILRNSEMKYGGVIQVLIFAVTILLICTTMFVFPILAKFDNGVIRTIKNAFVISIMQFPKTVLMVILYAIPLIIFFFIVSLMPIALMFGLAIPAWCSAKMYNKFFKKLEDQILAANPVQNADGDDSGEDVRIFRDELDESLADRK